MQCCDNIIILCHLSTDCQTEALLLSPVFQDKKSSVNVKERMSGVEANMHLQSEQARIRTVNLFCGATALLGSPYLFFLVRLHDYLSTAVMAAIIAVFLLCISLNRKGFIAASCLLIVINTNFSVLYFSSLLGFTSGIHLYLFTSPLIVYLLFDFKQRGKIILTFASYLFTFIAIFLIDKYQVFDYKLPDSSLIPFLYGLNFCFALILAFLLIVYFANNNASYNHVLEKQNLFLLLHKDTLMDQIAERLQAEEKLKESLQEKNVLLSEIHHRVKNNLALVSGLLELQGLSETDEKVQAVFSQSRNRIKSLAAIHESLYQSENIACIRFDQYFQKLFNEVIKLYPATAADIELRSTLQPIKLDIAQAIPCGLLVNEIISNAYKYAFTGRTRGLIQVTATEKESFVILEVRDDGCGLPPENEMRSGSLGMTLIASFVQQLKGTLEKRNENGAVFRICFPYKKIPNNVEEAYEKESIDC